MIAKLHQLSPFTALSDVDLGQVGEPSRPDCGYDEPRW